ncbi:MAG: DUF6157 family protein [Gordonia sp. (in: high G+C Gram-positive bacteria)]|uniref:DUF6157 family protein n=1 Tax=Gordonia sp. (in: high G+C Gram-positive bacteria) TaxID=84139 RepID=UPI0039E3075F
MGTTDYTSTFLSVAEDCPVGAGQEPPAGKKAPSVAELQFAMLAAHPYEHTSDDVLFDVYAQRRGIEAADRAAAREEFFSRSQACLRASPLGKRYGWGIHYDAEGRIAVVPLGSDRYRELAADPDLRQLKAMRSKRA